MAILEKSVEYPKNIFQRGILDALEGVQPKLPVECLEVQLKA